MSGNVKVAIDCHLSRKKISLRSRYNVGKHGKIEERVKMVDKCVQHECVQHECVGTKKEEQWPMMTFGER